MFFRPLAWTSLCTTLLATPLAQAESGTRTTAPGPVADASPSASAAPNGVSAAAGSASAPNSETSIVEQARQRFAIATKLYKDGDFSAALVQFERAYELKPNYKVLYNIGQTYFQLRQYVEARDAMSRYVHDGGAQIDAERLAAVNKDIADLDKRIATLTLNVNVNGASVLIDGKRAGTTPLSGPIAVSEGERTVSVEVPQRGVLQRLIRIAGGEQQSLTLNFDVSSPPSAQPSAAPSPHSARLGAGFWATALGAVALGAGAGVTGYLALDAQHENDDQRKRFGVTTSQLEDSNRRAKGFALTTDVLTGAAIVCAGVAMVIWATTPSYTTEVGLAVGPGSANVVGRF